MIFALNRYTVRNYGYLKISLFRKNVHLNPDSDNYTQNFIATFIATFTKTNQTHSLTMFGAFLKSTTFRICYENCESIFISFLTSQKVF